MAVLVLTPGLSEFVTPCCSPAISVETYNPFSASLTKAVGQETQILTEARAIKIKVGGTGPQMREVRALICSNRSRRPMARE